MKQVFSNLHIGSQEDYENIVKHQEGWYVIHACKEPYHRDALGYKGRAASMNHPEYLMAFRDNTLILNLVDAPDPAYISKSIIDEAIKAIHDNINSMKVFVHCNQGFSRSAVIGLLYLHKVGLISTDNFSEAEQQFIVLYPWYNPGEGMRQFALSNWNNYKSTR
ncbi:MAG: phosphatase [Bacteroidetes bacterium HGW-Bacteroidetes-5]|jgi:hypothetical protein|nr:MAG: phosphatase [Bacteroidetes bacterium HGW-Bacteroidetes-5]